MGKKLVYATTSGAPDRILGLGELAAAGAFSALPQALVAAPVERVKVVLQVSVHDPGLCSILAPQAGVKGEVTKLILLVFIYLCNSSD